MMPTGAGLSTEQISTVSSQAPSRHRFVSLRSVFSFPAAIAAILIAKAFFTCRDNIADTDLWWHLRNAQTIILSWHLPSADTYSFTAVGSRLIDHSWLSELTYYSAFRLLGLRGIFVVFAVAVTVMSLAVFLLCMRRTTDPLVAGMATIIGGLLAMVGFTPRAQNFGWLCFTAIFGILLHYRTTRRAPLWFIPPLFCIWINFHPGWPMGLVVFGVMLLSGLIVNDIGHLSADPWTNAEFRKLIVTMLLSIAALFVNPFGWRLVAYPLDVFIRQKLNVALGGEWASVNFDDMRGVFVLVTLLAVFVAALLPRKRWRIDDAILVTFAVFCGLTHIRFLVMAGIVLPPLLVVQFGDLSSYDPNRERPIVNALVIGVVVVMLSTGFPDEQRLEAEVAQLFPVAALNYLRTYPQTGNIFNQYEWGGFLEWHMPQIRPFIDSRTDIFEYNGVLRDYVSISTFDKSQELFDKYDINYVLYPAHTPLAYFLSSSSKWECIYQDKQAVIYHRLRAQGGRS